MIFFNPVLTLVLLDFDILSKCRQHLAIFSVFTHTSVRHLVIFFDPVLTLVFLDFNILCRQHLAIFFVPRFRHLSFILYFNFQVSNTWQFFLFCLEPYYITLVFSTASGVPPVHKVLEFQKKHWSVFSLGFLLHKASNTWRFLFPFRHLSFFLDFPVVHTCVRDTISVFPGVPRFIRGLLPFLSW